MARSGTEKPFILFLSLFFAIFACVAIVVLAVAAQTSPSSSSPSSPTSSEDKEEYTILVSLDGFRHDYFDIHPGKAPTLESFRRDGVYADRMVPIFPSKTFPNHWSIVTGLNAESHGIVANSFYDPVFDEEFHLWSTRAVRNASWWGGEPIWAAAEKSGLTTACYYWPGSEAPVGGVRPTYYKAFDGSVPLSTRVDGVLNWLALNKTARPSFVTLYMESVDHQGHSYGPFSNEVGEAMSEVDAALLRLNEGLRRQGIEEKTNLIIVSDHGMTDLSPNRVFFIDDYIDMKDVFIVDYWPVCHIRIRRGREGNVTLDDLFEKLDGANPHIHAYMKNDLPARFHFRSNRRIAPLLLVADLGWVVSTRSNFNRNGVISGSHGFDNEDLDMGAIFTAKGPSFKQGGINIGTIRNLDLVNMMAAIMDIHPPPNNGTQQARMLALKNTE